MCFFRMSCTSLWLNFFASSRGVQFHLEQVTIAVIACATPLKPLMMTTIVIMILLIAPLLHCVDCSVYDDDNDCDYDDYNHDDENSNSCVVVAVVADADDVVPGV